MFISGKDSQVISKDAFEAHIDARAQGSMLQIRNIFENNSTQEVSFRYKFKCARKGRSGTAVSSQSGGVKAAPGQEMSLSQTSISLSPNDTFTISLEIFDGTTLVASDTLVYPN